MVTPSQTSIACSWMVEVHIAKSIAQIFNVMFLIPQIVIMIKKDFLKLIDEKYLTKASAND